MRAGSFNDKQEDSKNSTPTMSLCKHALHKNSKNFGASQKTKKGEPKDHLGWQAAFGWIKQAQGAEERQTVTMKVK